MRLLSDLSRYDWIALALTFVGSGTPGLLTLTLTTESNINAGTIVLAAMTPLATTALTEHLTSVVSTPIFSLDHTRKLAVLTVDSEAPNSASNILSGETLGRAPQHARLLSSVLEVSSLV